MRELHRGRDSESCESADILRRQKLRVLHALAQAERLPVSACLLEGIEGIAVRLVADRVDGDWKACAGCAANQVGELLAARDLDSGAVEQARGL